MSNPKYLPKTPEDRRARLREEIGEVLQCDGKADRFGLDTRYDVDAHGVSTDPRVESNREAMLRELNDLKVTIAAVEADLRETPAVVEARGGCHDWTPNAERCARHREPEETPPRFEPIPAAVLARDEGPPLPQMIANRRAQLESCFCARVASRRDG